MIIDCFKNQNPKNSQMSCLVTAVLEITECFYRKEKGLKLEFTVSEY
jgi:hypothetical protein